MESSRKFAKVYRLSDAKNPPPMKFVDVSGRSFNTIGAITFKFYEDVNIVVQYEPSCFGSMVLDSRGSTRLGSAASSRR